MWLHVSANHMATRTHKPQITIANLIRDNPSKPRFENGTLNPAVLTAKRLPISSHDGLHVQRQQPFVCAPSVQAVSRIQARYHEGPHLVLMLAHSSHRFLRIKDVNVYGRCMNICICGVGTHV